MDTISNTEYPYMEWALSFFMHLWYNYRGKSCLLIGITDVLNKTCTESLKHWNVQFFLDHAWTFLKKDTVFKIFSCWTKAFEIIFPTWVCTPDRIFCFFLFRSTKTDLLQSKSNTYKQKYKLIQKISISYDVHNFFLYNKW